MWLEQRNAYYTLRTHEAPRLGLGVQYMRLFC